VLLGYLIAFPQNREIPFLLIATTIIFVLGVVDDLKGVHFSTKFFVQVTAALLVVQSGVLFDLNRISILESLNVQFGQISLTAVTLIWIVGITNAVNLIDGMDGLASGLCFNASVGIGAIALLTGKPGLAIICVVIAGGLLGFLRYNAEPARTYLGDSGSMLLGFTLAVISIMQSAKTSTFLVLVIPVLLLAIPMADTALAFLRRTIRGENPFKPDRRHLHHKLLDLNFSVRQALVIFYCLSASLGILALWLFNSNNAQLIALALLFLITVIGAVKVMQVYNFHDLIKRINRRIRAVARKAVSRERSTVKRLTRNLTLLATICLLNMVLIMGEISFHGIYMTGIAGLFVLGAVDFALNLREDEPRYEIQHTIIFLSIVLNQIIVVSRLPGEYVQSPLLAAASLTILVVVVVFLFMSGTFATFLQDPVEILGLFIALVIIALTRHFMNSSALLPFAAALFNALILYTLSKVYLAGYRISTGFVTAGLAAFVIALAGMALI
jgi:UDP-GlcNAc:undecaprenyl-phosphate GlcNAc-1-phosphate transferase